MVVSVNLIINLYTAMSTNIKGILNHSFVTARAQLVSHFSRFNINLESVNSMIVLVSSILIALTLFKSIPFLSSYITTIFYLSILFLVILNWNISPYIRKALLFSSFLVLLALIVSVFYTNYLNDFYLRGVFICLGIVTVASIKFNIKILKWQSIVFAAMLIITFIKSFNYYESFSNTNFISDNVDYTNPNTYAFIALISILYLDRISLLRNRLLKIILLSIATITILNYSSRASLFCLLAYWIITYFLNNHSRISRKLLYFSVITAALIFPIIYVSIYERSVANNTSYTFLGKDIFSGRQELWALAKDKSNSTTILLGNSNSSLKEKGSRTSDVHNMYISFVYYAGLIYSIILVLFIYYCFVKNIEIHLKTFSYLLALLLLGFFETALIGGGIFAMAALLAFVNYDDTTNQIRPSMQLSGRA